MNFDLQSYDLTANTPRRINLAGRQFLVVAASGNLTVHAVRNQSRQGRITGAPQGIAIRTALASEGFHGLDVESDQTETIKLAIADDDVDLSAIASSVTIASPLSNGAVQVLQDDDTNGRSGLTTLEGATRFTANNTTTTIATAAANTDGVIVRLAAVKLAGTGTGRLHIGSSVFDLGKENANGASRVVVRDLMIQSGVQVDISSTSASVTVEAWAEVL